MDSDTAQRLNLLSQRIGALERKVDYLLHSLNLNYQEALDSEPAFMAQVRALVAARKTIEAIKIYRENTGASLADAKNIVESL